jgi:hypothetical protein
MLNFVELGWASLLSPLLLFFFLLLLLSFLLGWVGPSLSLSLSLPPSLILLGFGWALLLSLFFSFFSLIYFFIGLG